MNNNNTNGNEEEEEIEPPPQQHNMMSNNNEKEEPRISSSLLQSPYWVKIQEEYGQNSFNFIPGSRRAASSVVYTYKRQEKEEEEDDRILQNEMHQDSGVTKNNNNMHTNITESNTAKKINDGNNNTIASSSLLNEMDKYEQSPSPKQTSKKSEEYMIISGGFTDNDWSTFPVYAFPITSAIHSLSGQWMDLSPPVASNTNTATDIELQCNYNDTKAAQDRLYQKAKYFDANANSTTKEDPWEKAEPCAPYGRMGHQSVILNDYLYVFGGLIYDEEQASTSYRKRESFRLEDVPYVYRLDLRVMFEVRKTESNNNGGGQQPRDVRGWERIIPRIRPFSTYGTSSVSAAEILLSSINRGDMQGGLWKNPDKEGEGGGHDKLIMYGGLRIAKIDYGGPLESNGPSKFVKGGSAHSSFGYHPAHKIIELPLGDVWAYDLVDDCWEKMTTNYGKGVDVYDDSDIAFGQDDDDLFSDLGADYTLYPRPRTAHAATVVDNKLIIHGGMGWDEHTNDWDGSTDWTGLSDLWIFNLDDRTWTRRNLFPRLVRSYHTLVGWQVNSDEGNNILGFGNQEVENWEGRPVVAAFGGYTTDIDIFSGDEMAYVFDDLLISYPPPMDTDTEYSDSTSLWYKMKDNYDRDGAETISTRYEHSAVLSKEGVLAVWGGSFKDTSSVKGMWMVNIAGEYSNVELSMAESDTVGLEQTLGALHTIVFMLMFMSISFTLLLGLTQRYQELVAHANQEAAVLAGFPPNDLNNGAPPPRRGNGLHPEIINTLPRKIYSSANEEAEGDEEAVCCICLTEFSNGDELRVLPCNHFMHTDCLDGWLANHPSCPSCRYSLSELVDDRPMMQLRTLRSRIGMARFMGSDFAAEGGIEMTDAFSLPRNGVIDLRYISSLALDTEEGTNSNQGEVAASAEDLEQPRTQTPAMDNLSEWRRRRMQLRRERRRSGLESLAQNISRIRQSRSRRSRIPLVDTDE